MRREIIMTKFRLYFDKDKETIWLNEMAAKGYALKNFFAGFYQFEDCEPGEYTYQIDIDSKFASVTDDYREFMEENKIEIVCLWGYWNILRKKSADGEFVLYTDVDSTIEHYTKILTLFKVVTIIEMLCFLLEAFAAFRGQAVGIFGMFLAGLFTFVMMRATFSTKRTILSLKEKKGESVVNETENTTPSPILYAGLILNLGAVVLNHSESISHNIILCVQIIAIILMLIGVYQSRSIFRK